jgi:hypothetical protein
MFSYYYGLIFDCPVGNEVANCEFKNIRKFRIKERLVYYDKLAEEEKIDLIEKHQRCLSAREKKSLFHESQ